MDSYSPKDKKQTNVCILGFYLLQLFPFHFPWLLDLHRRLDFFMIIQDDHDLPFFSFSVEKKVLVKQRKRQLTCTASLRSVSDRACKIETNSGSFLIFFSSISTFSEAHFMMKLVKYNLVELKCFVDYLGRNKNVLICRCFLKILI